MEESRFTLNGALLLMRPEGLTMVATDGHRLAYVQASPAESGTADKPFRALIPKKAMSELTKLSDDAGADAKAIVAGDDNHLFFQLGQRLLITRKLTGNFPDYERVLPKDHQFIAKLEKAEIRSAIERVAQFADERARCGCSPRAWKRARAKRRSPANIPGRISRSASMRSIYWIFCVRFRRIRWRSS
jgi:DNA polymerase-3 subunit beta